MLIPGIFLPRTYIARSSCNVNECQAMRHISHPPVTARLKSRLFFAGAGGRVRQVRQADQGVGGPQAPRLRLCRYVHQPIAHTSCFNNLEALGSYGDLLPRRRVAGWGGVV